jgi:hypothetical protein
VIPALSVDVAGVPFRILMAKVLPRMVSVRVSQLKFKTSTFVRARPVLVGLNFRAPWSVDVVLECSHRAVASRPVLLFKTTLLTGLA